MIIFKHLRAYLTLSVLFSTAVAMEGPSICPSVVAMNGHSRQDLKIETPSHDTWRFEYRRDLQTDPTEWLNRDAPQTDMRWKNWAQPGRKWMNGMYGTHLTFQIEFPYPVASIVAESVVANHADATVRRACLEYSFDNRQYHPIAEVGYAGGEKKIAGKVDIKKPNINRLWLRLRQKAGDANVFRGLVIFKKFSFTVTGPIRELTTEDVQAARAQIENEYQQKLLQKEKDRFAGLLAHLEPLGDRSAVRHIGVVSSMINVFPGEPPKPDQVDAGLSLTAARREHESAQIVISAGPEPLAVDRVEVADLRQIDGKGRIKADRIEVRLVGYAYLDKLSWRGIERLGLWPDPLLRFQPFVCPPGQARSLWVTVEVPEDVVAGKYEGAIRIFSNNKSLASVPLELQVRDFTLPDAPRLHTSYWTHFESAYNLPRDEAILDGMIRMFGFYRVSTNVAQTDDVVWYREPDGTVTCDWDRLRRRLKLAAASGFRTLNIGPGVQGNFGDAYIGWGIQRNPASGAVIDRITGKGLDYTAATAQITPEARARAYLVPLADWLEREGLLDRAYLQIADEQMNQEYWPTVFLPGVKLFRAVEPRIPLLSVLGIHPIHQGWFDIASPHCHFYDATAYQMMRDGVSLYGSKNFAARVTASSTGGWSGSSFYTYSPADAYDGCDYTKWIPKEPPTKDQPQWLRFDFEKPESIDGLRLEPYGRVETVAWDGRGQAPDRVSSESPSSDVPGATWSCEGSIDGKSFQPLQLTARRGAENSWNFKRETYRAIRLVWTSGILGKPQNPKTVGARGVEFLRKDVPLEATRPRNHVRPVKMMWEYQIAATYPSVNIDADPAEARATAWQCWVREVAGYLNWGGAQWEGFEMARPITKDPLVWPDIVGGNGHSIVYPGKNEVLPSVRLVRFRDGIDDYDYLALLAERQPNHSVLARIRDLGNNAYRSISIINANRRAVGDALEK